MASLEVIPEEVKATLRGHTQRNQGRSWEEIVGGVNRSLRGWYEYYQHSEANVFAPLDGFVRRRLRSLLEKATRPNGAWERDSASALAQ